MPRFTLRTLFAVVTVLAAALGWLMWQRSIVQERQAALRSICDRGGGYSMATPALWGGDITVLAGDLTVVGNGFVNTPDTNPGWQMRSPSWLRMWLGDQLIPDIWLPDDATNVESMALASQFPEANIRAMPGPGQRDGNIQRGHYDHPP